MSKLPLLLILLLCTCDRAPEKEVLAGQTLLLPQVRQLAKKDGQFLLPSTLNVTVTAGTETGLTDFLNELTTVTGTRYDSTSGTAGLQLTTDVKLSAEGYVLDVTPEGITLAAATDAGHFYGLQTLRQLLHPAFAAGEPRPDVNWAIPAVHIEDAPTFPWRGFMLDVSRHFFTVDQVKDVIDLAAAQKLNRLHLHLTDDQGWRVEIKSYPKLTEVGGWRADRTNTDERYSDWWGRTPLQPDEKPTYGGFYTQEDIREIVAYAAGRQMAVIPEIDLPGHAQAAVAAYPEIGCVNAAPHVATGGVFKNNTVNPGRKATYVFAEKMLNEIMDLFPFDYVHIGGDECNKSQWKADPDAQRKMRQEGLKSEEELQSYFIERMEKIINARGKKMIGWDEILEGGLAPNATVMSWRGEAGGIAAAEAGHEVIMTPSNACYLDLKQGHDDLEPNLGYSRLLLSTAYHHRVIPEGFTDEQAALVLGTQANLWTESISDWGKLTYMVYPRLYAVAENAWTPEARQDWDDFTDRLVHAYERLDARGVRYATSAFSPWLHHQRLSDTSIEVRLETEVNGLEIRYTLDGSQPGSNVTLYTAPFILKTGQTVQAQSFRDGAPIGYVTSLDLPVHLAAGASVRDKAGKSHPELTDLQYAKLTPVDTNWVKFKDQETLTLRFAEPTRVSSVRFATLRYTISGIYPPTTIELAGQLAGTKKFVPLAELEQLDKALVQGRNKVESTLQFSPVEVTALRLDLRTHRPVPEGHHRAGGKARMYLGEVVVE